MKFSFMSALTIGILSACTSPAQNTGPVDPFIESCIGDGFSHQVCACTAIKMRTEIGEPSYQELLAVLARMTAAKAQGVGTSDIAPNTGLDMYYYYAGRREVLTQRDNNPGLAYRANRDLCMALTQN